MQRSYSAFLKGALPMNIFKYPFPARKLSQSQDDEMNIGFAQGVFSDGRPFHAECWASEGTTNLTFFFSTIGLENYQKRDVISYLAGEGVIELRLLHNSKKCL
jgi:hypothetical protein